MKLNTDEVYKATKEAIESKPQYSVWSLHDLIQETNKRLKRYKISNASQMCRIARQMRSYNTFTNSKNGTIYIFIPRCYCKQQVTEERDTQEVNIYD